MKCYQNTLWLMYTRELSSPEKPCNFQQKRTIYSHATAQMEASWPLLAAGVKFRARGIVYLHHRELPYMKLLF